MNSTRRDVIIIGAGLAGLNAAIGFRKRGFSVALFEQGQFPMHKVCGEYLSLESWNHLVSRVPELASLDLPVIDQLMLSLDSGQVLKSKLPLGGIGISRFVLDHLLVQTAKTMGVEVFEATKVQDWQYDQVKDSFQVNSLQGEYEAKLLVGAFGKRSNMDRIMNRKFRNKPVPYMAVKYHVNYPIEKNQIALHQFKNGYCGISAVEEGKACLCYLAKSEEVKKAGGIPAFEQKVMHQNPYLKEIWEKATFLWDKPLSIAGFAFYPKSIIDDNVPMIGDAAGIIPPLAGNGMSMAIHASELLVSTYSPMLEGKETRGEVERRYMGLWNATFSRRLSVGRLLQYFFEKEWLMKALMFSLNPLPF
ncbi:MAG: NAD(P)/FAD-dependent oxidoreductase, partial [Bacteroidota bacterium]|nr:NAD(P)/FAD-dependent oxidoreductase [Bacteroidota bacterium]MDX5430447.1 NAD(P)/FAD-dependent oxidoreductase [Bacteroidota bacterium]MDX5469206.1 NAD(P)/FAD-dependent oxidoreductase [Bacteroidota bacterium]